MFQSRLFMPVLFLILFLTACTPQSEPEPTLAPGETSSDSAVERLALRLLTYRYPDSPEPPKTQLLPEQLPPDYDLPRPSNATVVGSLIREEESTVVLDSDQTPEQIFRFFEEAMSDAGWEVAPEPGHGGGFVPDRSTMGQNFCHEEAGRILWVTAYPVDGQPTDVRLSLRSDEDYSPCRDISPGTGPQGAQALIPSLAAPPGVQQRGGGGGSSDNNAYTSASLETELAASALADHYSQQLQEAGWTQLDEGDSGPVSWHTWSFQDEEGEAWQGLFFVTEIPQSTDRHTVYLEISQAP
jgi:hypothetical protein